jgi:hypothetical protein
MIYLIHLVRDSVDGYESSLILTDSEHCFDSWNNATTHDDDGWEVAYISHAQDVKIDMHIVSTTKEE